MSLVDKELVSKLVAELVKKGFDEAAVKVEATDSVMTKIANSSVSVVQSWRRISVNLYLAKDKRIFILSFEPKSFEDIAKPVDTILSMASKVAESPIYAPLPKPSKPSHVEDLVDRDTVKAMDSIDAVAERVIEVAHRERIDYVAGMIHIGYRELVLATSKDGLFEERKTFAQGYLRAFAEPDGSGQWCYTSTKLDIRGFEEMASIAARYAVDSRNRGDVEPGVYDVILSPMVFANLLEYIVRMTSAASVFLGWSMFMKNKPGDVVASQHLTVVDAPRNSELPGHRSVDDEGVETFNKPIIERGVLKTFLHNTKTATLMRASSTGNAGWLMPTPWNLIVEPGTATLDEMIAEVRRGLLITNNWYTRLQSYVEGVFSTVARDAIFLIENGRIVKPVTKIRIADKFGNLLKNIEILGKDLYNIQWWEVRVPTKIPYALVRNINISKHVV